MVFFEVADKTLDIQVSNFLQDALDDKTVRFGSAGIQVSPNIIVE